MCSYSAAQKINVFEFLEIWTSAQMFMNYRQETLTILAGHAVSSLDISGQCILWR